MNVNNLLPILLVIAAYVLLLSTSGWVVGSIMKFLLNETIEEAAAEGLTVKEDKKNRLDVGMVIGKCENILILSFLLMDAFTALALVVTAKTIVRKEEMQENSKFFLAGTLINVSYSVVVGLALKLICTALNITIFKK